MSNVDELNSLQEVSRVFRAFVKGGPSFGAWQVAMELSCS